MACHLPVRGYEVRYGFIVRLLPLVDQKLIITVASRMYGAPDRGGAREGKKSLRKTKQNIDAKVSGIQTLRQPARTRDSKKRPLKSYLLSSIQ